MSIHVSIPQEEYERLMALLTEPTEADIERIRSATNTDDLDITDDEIRAAISAWQRRG